MRAWVGSESQMGDMISRWRGWGVLVRNSMLFSDVTSKCVLSILLSMCFSNKHSSCNINSNKKSYSSLSYSDTSSKSSLSTVSQINTSWNVNSNYKSCSSRHANIFSKHITSCVKCSSFKIEDILPYGR